MLLSVGQNQPEPVCMSVTLCMFVSLSVRMLAHLCVQPVFCDWTRLQGICIPMPEPRMRPGEELLAVQYVHSCVIALSL